MDFAFTDEQRELRETARAFLAERSSGEHVRRAMESELGHDPELWKQLSGDLGWTALGIPEAYGGLGLGPVELSALLEITGEALLCAPLFSSLALGAPAILCAGSEAQKAAWLPGVAEGRTRATLALLEPGVGWDLAGLAARARRDGGAWVLSGTKRHVVDGHCADLLLVAARCEGEDPGSGPALFAVPGESGGLTRRALPTLDRTRRLAEIELREVRLDDDARLPGAGPEAGGGLARALDLARIALSAELVGVAQRCLDLSVAYAKERVQFGRPIGSFQAIQHKCADMMVALEAARSGAYYAACAAAEDSDELPALASLAKASASEAAFRCAADAIQIHGGVGFTWEYDVHLYFKRARAAEGFLGTPAFHRERVARAMGL